MQNMRMGQKNNNKENQRKRRWYHFISDVAERTTSLYCSNKLPPNTSQPPQADRKIDRYVQVASVLDLQKSAYPHFQGLITSAQVFSTKSETTF